MKTNKKFSLFLIVLVFNTQIYAKPKVAVSITPIASLAAMLLGDDAEISIIAASNSCPHHFHPTPGNLKQVKEADIGIFIDEGFDGFASKLMKSNSADIIKIGDIQALNITKDDKGPNWHIWLDLSNVQTILISLSNAFSNQFPATKQTIAINLEKSLQQIIELTKLKKQKLSEVGKIVLLSDSLEYFFTDNLNTIKLYEPEHKSLKFLSELDNKVSGHSKISCLVLSTDQNIEFYRKYKLPTVRIESENWIAENNLRNLYFTKYSQMIHQLQDCLVK